MLRRFSINFALLSMAIDALAIVLSMVLAVQVRPLLNDLSFVERVPLPVFLPTNLYFLFPFIWVSLLAVASIYDGRKFLRVVDEFTAISLASFLASISLAGVLYLSFRDVSRTLFGIIVLIAYLLLLAWRVLARLYFRSRNNFPDEHRRILIVGAGTLGQKVRAQLEKEGVENLTFVGFLDDIASSFNESTNLLGSWDEIRDVTQNEQITDIIIALPHSLYQNMGTIVTRLDDISVRVWIALGFFDLALYKTEMEDFAGIPMLDLRAPALSEYQRIIKRAFDLVLGLLAFLIIFPVICLVALIVWLDDGYPIIFRQKRVGANGRIFDIYKFRTMFTNVKELQKKNNKNHKTKNDPRITRTGGFLRRFSLDELPQLVNVLAGDMSLVGPRPELPYLVEQYQPWQRKRFAVPPGITGWWQVTGRSDKPMHLNTEDDLYYIKNYSLMLDLQILIRTIWAVLLGRGAY